MRTLIEKLPESSRDAMRKCVVQLQRTDENGIVHQSVSNVNSFFFFANFQEWEWEVSGLFSKLIRIQPFVANVILRHFAFLN